MPVHSQNIRVGLTGGFGCGKSAVAAVFSELGARVIDADRLARAALEPGTPVYREVVDVFGSGVVGDDGRIDRRALAKIVFSDPSRRAMLEAIVHPPVLAALRRELTEGEGIRVAEIPLLYETDAAGFFDLIVAVVADREQVIDRVGRARKMTLDEIEKRLDSQLPPAEKARRADYVVDNNGSPDQMRRQVEKIYDQLQKRKEGGSNG